MQYTPKPLCEYGADGDGMYPVPCHYGDFCKPASENITPQPQSANSGFQGLGGGALNKLFAKCINFALLAAMQK